MSNMQKEISNDFLSALQNLQSRVEQLEKEVQALKAVQFPQENIQDSDSEPIDLTIGADVELHSVHTAYDEHKETAAEVLEEEISGYEENLDSQEDKKNDSVEEESSKIETDSVEKESESAKSEKEPVEAEQEHSKVETEFVEAEEGPVKGVSDAGTGLVTEKSDEVADSFVSLFGETVEVEKPKKHTKEAKDSTKKDAVIDVMTDRIAWYHDMPGSEVKSLRSAIALGDQVVFIKNLFRDDSALYRDTIDRLNSMKKLDEAVKYLTSTFPEWDMESDDVYRFMMAVRRRIR